MKVILLEDVKAVGKKGEVCEVSDAYARNVLLRGKKAVEATGKNLNDLKLQRSNDEKIAARQLEEAKELAEKIEGGSVSLKVKVGEGGKVFGSISTKEIAEAIRDQLGLSIDKKKVMLTSPLRAVGETAVPIKLHTRVTAQLKVSVTEA